MAKAEWGTKRTCQTCAARFYDLKREPILCPVCGAANDPERQPKPRRPGPLIKEEPVLAPRLDDEVAVDEDLADAAAAETDIEDLDDSADDETAEDELATEDGELIEDTSELGEDDDDIGEVMEHVDEEIDDKP